MDNWFAYVHEGHAKHPCTRLACIHGLAVGRVRPYPLHTYRQIKEIEMGLFITGLGKN